MSSTPAQRVPSGTITINLRIAINPQTHVIYVIPSEEALDYQREVAERLRVDAKRLIESGEKYDHGRVTEMMTNAGQILEYVAQTELHAARLGDALESQSYTLRVPSTEEVADCEKVASRKCGYLAADPARQEMLNSLLLDCATQCWRNTPAPSTAIARHLGRVLFAHIYSEALAAGWWISVAPGGANTIPAGPLSQARHAADATAIAACGN